MYSVSRLDQHYLIKVPDSWIIKAKQIRDVEDLIPGTQRLSSDNRWAGKLGEWAVELAFPSLVPVTQHFSPTNYDFRKNGHLYEVKTKVGNSALRSDFQFDVNARQFEMNGNDVYISCFYMLNSPLLRIVGWIYKDDVLEKGSLLEKGEFFRGKYEVWADRISVPFSDLEPLSSLPI